MFIELESGTVDIAYSIPANDIERLKENENTDVVERLSTTVEYLDMNVTKKPLDDVRVRQAIDYAINEQAIEDIVYRGTASYSPTTVTPGMKYLMIQILTTGMM